MISIQQIQQRYALLETWLKSVLADKDYHIQLLAGDASFRRYYRLQFADHTLVAMDAPPDLEDSHSFVAIAGIFDQLGLAVPKILAADLSAGFLLLTDLGDNLYSKALTPDNFLQLYNNAITQLLVMQQCPRPEENFPLFDEALLHSELSRFQEWYLTKHLQLTLNRSEEKLIAKTFEKLIQAALAQPQVFVHRDYHSRNLFALPQNKVGIIDFQDALWGPITYDVISLIRDCYIAWPKTDVIQLANNFYQQAQTSNYRPNYVIEQFFRDLDWMGMQRHLKAIYIFARKWQRDGNHNYLNDIPRTLNYIYDICKNYREFADFQLFLEDRILS